MVDEDPARFGRRDVELVAALHLYKQAWHHSLSIIA